MMTDDCPELVRFVRGEIDPAVFPHREHVRMAFEMLRRHDFAETVLHYSRALRAMSAKAGKPQAFNQTVTIAFLSLLAERIELGNTADFTAFVRDNADLLDKCALTRWYRPERLASEAARNTFLMPDPARDEPAALPD
ncbi:MAG: hypothetical protein WAK94_08515 [Steroidobacteraceae bacterium]